MEVTQRVKITRATLQIIFALAAVIAVVSMVYSWVVHEPSAYESDSVYAFSSDWSVLSGVSSKRVSLPASVEFTSKGELTMTNVLPDSIADNEIMLVATNHQNLEVLVDGESIYVYESQSIIGSFYGKYYCFVPITSDMAGKEVTLIFTTDDNVSRTYVELPIIGGSATLLQSVIRNNAFTVATGSFFLLLGIALIIGSIAMYAFKFRQKNLAVLMLGLFFALLALSSLSQTGLLSFICSNESFIYLLGYAAQMLMIVPLLCYFIEVLNFNHRLLVGLCEISLISFIVQYIIYLYGTFDFYNMEVITLAIILVCAVYLVYCLGSEFIKYRRKETVFEFIAVLVFAFMAIADVLYRFVFRDYSPLDFNSACSFICSVILFIDAVRLFAEEVSERQGQNMSSQMAFLDGLTRMANRSSYNRHFEQLYSNPDVEHNVATIDICLDLSELIQINEKSGYNAGDEIVLGCADCVKKSDKGIGKSYRISGNEFVVIIEDNVEEKVSAFINTFNRTLHEFNSRHTTKLHVKLGHSSVSGKMSRDILVGCVDQAKSTAEEVNG